MAYKYTPNPIIEEHVRRAAERSAKQKAKAESNRIRRKGTSNLKKSLEAAKQRGVNKKIIGAAKNPKTSSPSRTGVKNVRKVLDRAARPVKTTIPRPSAAQLRDPTFVRQQGNQAVKDVTAKFSKKVAAYATRWGIKALPVAVRAVSAAASLGAIGLTAYYGPETIRALHSVAFRPRTDEEMARNKDWRKQRAALEKEMRETLTNSPEIKALDATAARKQVEATIKEWKKGLGNESQWKAFSSKMPKARETEEAEGRLVRRGESELDSRAPTVPNEYNRNSDWMREGDYAREAADWLLGSEQARELFRSERNRAAEQRDPREVTASAPREVAASAPREGGGSTYRGTMMASQRSPREAASRDAALAQPSSGGDGRGMVPRRRPVQQPSPVPRPRPDPRSTPVQRRVSSKQVPVEGNPRTIRVAGYDIDVRDDYSYPGDDYARGGYIRRRA